MAYKALTAILATVLLLVASGCHALGFAGGSGIPGTHFGTVPPGTLGQIPAGAPSPAESALIVAPWAIAVTLAAVVVAFLVKLLRRGPSVLS